MDNRFDNGPKKAFRKVSRREFFVYSIAATGAIVLPGCGGGSLFGGSSGGGGLTQRNRSLAVNPNKFVTSEDLGLEISFLGSFTDNGIQAALWGTQTNTGEADKIYQALVWDTDATQGARTRFDGQGSPAQIVDQSSGAFLSCDWEDDSAVFRFYQPSGAYVGGVRVQGTSPNFQFEQLGDSAVVGYFSGTLANATEGIFAFTVGGVQQVQDHHTASALGNRTAGQQPPLNTSSPNRYSELLDGLNNSVATVDASTIAKALILAIADEYAQKGSSNLFDQIRSTALEGTGLSNLFPNKGRTILRGLIATELLRTVLVQFLAEDPNTLVTNGLLTTALSGPGFTDYLSVQLLPEANPSEDHTLVSGIAVSREFGVTALYGYIDSAGRVSVDGTNSEGVQIELIGTVQGDNVTGTWTSTPSNRSQGGGSFGGGMQPLGECQQQQLSGGQGTFTNSYDLHDCGNFPFSYEAYNIPDRFIVLNGQTQILDTGSISGGTTATLHASGASTIVTVIVVASLDGTAWNYTVGCPGD